MALRINLRYLERDDLTLKGELPVAELDLDLRDEMIRPEKPLVYELLIQKLDDNLLVRGRLFLPIACECVRCLKAFEYELDLPEWTCLLPLAGEEKVTITSDSVDLTPFLREDILLELPQHPLCKPECGGLKKPTPERPKSSSLRRTEPSAWAELNKLKVRNE
ncbi:MAG: YceD family protein [Verrucomicrobiota bacterium]|nr:DUF177 domain-containing protein [Verrucomicrobiota bacterium]MCC6820178.1 DUF177 domain-containing protein [Limisphaerales bacterium]